ncbi:MAG: class I SAM-dependent methyltransferase [Candidatus Aminicenantes bacterium]|nr:class I SAM-dependent methyltransferase [Candidatus Aminicenantes bacterium]MDH5468809.1 class I SAM-dependent methyltransferase [Candidatus Aminicenantes bacterium]
MKLTDVSKTAIVTLRSHVLESQKNKPIIIDSMAKYCLDKLISSASEDEKVLLFNRKLSSALTSHIAIRARKYDSIINDYISKNSSSIVVNLGCGFDTRYWRIDNKKCEYIELDLPEIVEIKKDLLKEHLSYELIACSVLDTSWIDRVTSKGNRNFLLVAEGLFMYLPKVDVINLFKVISERFYHSQIVLEVVTEKYTRGIWKKIIIMKMKQELGFDSGSSYNFGVKNALELESYGNGIKVIDEWSYVEDHDIRPRILKYMGLSRTQWTITATINENK